ncbi:MAG: Hint domain-containing protein, partial [Merismopedia sp. SIO2A8]|nr:Hint domain-containing protein [Merismopedia sp. SIO2A8]
VESEGSTTVSEGGGITDTYEIFLDTQPTSDVTITVTTDGNTNVDKTELTFTPSDFFIPQVVTVTAIADVMGNTNSTISHTAASMDTNYDSGGMVGLSIPGVTATILDTGITITERTPDPVVEGGTATYTITLNTPPTGNVTITATPNDMQTVIEGSSTLNFSPSVLSQTVTVRAVDDGGGEGLHTGDISHVITSSDAPEYPPALSLDSARININEPGVSIIQTDGDTTVSELGVNDTYTIALNSIPTDAMDAPTSITITVDPDEQTSVNGAAVGAPVDLIFDSSNLSRTVTVAANSDEITEGTHTSNISHTITVSDATAYPTNLPVMGVTATVIDCFLTGTRLLTDQGERRVEELNIGDRLQTFDGHLEPIKWVGIQTCYPNSNANYHPFRTFPIRIKAGALGNHLPIRDLYVSPDHALFMDGLLINAGALENGTSIVQTTSSMDAFVYYHIELERHNLVIAEGTPTESYLPQTQARNTFDNGDEYADLYPQSNIQALIPMPYPRVSSKRQLPRFITQSLQKIADGMPLAAPDSPVPLPRQGHKSVARIR